MAKSTKGKTGAAMTTATGRVPQSRSNQSAPTTESDIARLAYALYLARGCEPGHDVDDWLQAERELGDAQRSNPATAL